MSALLFPANHLARVQGKAIGPKPVIQEIARRLHARLLETTRPLPTILNLSNDGNSLQSLLPHAIQTPTPCDALLANLTLTTLEDPTAYLHEHLKYLKPDGLFLATTLGAGSFPEFRSAFHAANLPHTGRTPPLPDVQECGSLLQRLKLAMPVVDRDILTLTFPTMKSLISSLKAHGSHNWHPARTKGLTTPRQWHAMEETYTRLHTRSDGRIPLTLEIIYLHGWKPHASQPKPLQPGEGKVGLVKILSPHDEHFP